MTFFFPRFFVYKCASSLFTGIVFKFHMHVDISQKEIKVNNDHRSKSKEEADVVFGLSRHLYPYV